MRMNIDYPATIIKLRAILDLSQAALAELLGVSFTSVNRWENGKYEPTRLVKEKIRLICEQNNIHMEVVKTMTNKRQIDALWDDNPIIMPTQALI